MSGLVIYENFCAYTAGVAIMSKTQKIRAGHIWKHSVDIATDMAMAAESIDEAKAEEAVETLKPGCARRSLTRKWHPSMPHWSVHWHNLR